MTQEQNIRLENTKTWKKAKEESIGHQRAVCLGIKDRLQYALVCHVTILHYITLLHFDIELHHIISEYMITLYYMVTLYCIIQLYAPWLALWYGMVSHWLSGHFLEYSL